MDTITGIGISACGNCTRWSACGSERRKILPTIVKADPSRDVDCLFILPSADLQNGKTGQTFVIGQAAELFHKMVSRLGINYAVMGSVLCGSDYKVSRKEWKYCQDQVRELIDHMHPTVMVLMGEAPRDYVLNSHVSIRDAHKHVFSYITSGGHQISTLIAPDPNSQFFKKGAQDLRPVLGEVYELVDQIVKGTYHPPDIGHWEVINNKSSEWHGKGDLACNGPKSRANMMWRYREFVTTLEQEISLDCEFDTADSTDDTIWEEGKGGLVTVQSCGWSPENHRYETIVMDVRDWEPEELGEFFKMAFLQKVIVGSFLKIDIQCAWVNTSKVGQDRNFCSGTDILNFVRGWEDGHYVQWLQDQSLQGSGLKPRAMAAFGCPDWSVFFKDELYKLESGKDICSNINPETLYVYAASDAYYEIRWWREVGKKLVHNVEIPYAEIKETTATFLEMERTGILVDVQGLEVYKSRLEGEIAALQVWLDNHPWVINAGLKEFNSKSALQVTQMVDSQGLNIKKTETGLAAVNIDTLPHLTLEDPTKRTTDQEHFFGAIWDQRKKRDMISRSILPFQRYQQGGWCHPTYSLSKQERATGKEQGTVTGRQSGFRPNPNGMVADNDYLYNFKAPPGFCIVCRDYKTGEPCINAFLSQCQPLMDAFLLGVREPENPKADVYRLDQAIHLGISEGDLTDSQRDMGKKPWLAGTYGQGPEAIAEASGISVQEAEMMLFRFYSRYPELLAREAENRRKLFRGETFVTATGRRRTFHLSREYPYVHEQHKNYMGYQLIKELRMNSFDAEKLRQAGNNEIQGPLGQITFMAMNYIRKVGYQPGHGLQDARMFLSIHDSIWWYLPDDSDLKRKIDLLGKLMSSLWLFLPQQVMVNLKFPSDIPVLRTDFKIGENMGEMIKEKRALKGEWEFL